MRHSYTEEFKQNLKAGGNVGFMNQLKPPIEPCDCSSESIFVTKSCDRMILDSD